MTYFRKVIQKLLLSASDAHGESVNFLHKSLY